MWGAGGEEGKLRATQRAWLRSSEICRETFLCRVSEDSWYQLLCAHLGQGVELSCEEEVVLAPGKGVSLRAGLCTPGSSGH